MSMGTCLVCRYYTLNPISLFNHFMYTTSLTVIDKFRISREQPSISVATRGARDEYGRTSGIWFGA